MLLLTVLVTMTCTLTCTPWEMCIEARRYIGVCFNVRAGSRCQLFALNSALARLYSAARGRFRIMPPRLPRPGLEGIAGLLRVLLCTRSQTLQRSHLSSIISRY